MTQKEKAKAYDEALERARALNNGEAVDIKIGTTTCEYIFPELKESEDERIRKELIDFVKSRLAGFPECGRFIAWLEKQSKHSILNVPSREVILAIWDLGNEWKELTNGCISTEYGTQLEYIQKHWEESEYYLREKKVEPKFKVGDWVVDNSSYVWKIEGILNQFYILECPEGGESRPAIDRFDKNSHFWTIQDAKDGDVLSANWRVGANFWERIIIFKKYHSKDVKGLINAPYVEGYSNTFKNGKLISFAKVPCYSTWTNISADNLYPATKEQRDLLFQTMKEAGYEWDADNKELKKEEIK